MQRKITTAVSPAQRRRLYLVPDRRTALLPHVPASRTLHLVDIENLAGGSDAPLNSLPAVVQAYREAAPVNPGDHVLVAAGSRLAYAVGIAWPGTQLVVGRGVDGADRALLAHLPDVTWIATHFDRVVLGSGDGIFTETLAAIRAHGIATVMIAHPRSFSWVLQQHATSVRVLPFAISSERSA